MRFCNLNRGWMGWSWTGPIVSEFESASHYQILAWISFSICQATEKSTDIRHNRLLVWRHIHVASIFSVECVRWGWGELGLVCGLQRPNDDVGLIPLLSQIKNTYWDNSDFGKIQRYEEKDRSKVTRRRSRRRRNCVHSLLHRHFKIKGSNLNCYPIFYLSIPSLLTYCVTDQQRDRTGQRTPQRISNYRSQYLWSDQIIRIIAVTFRTEQIQRWKYFLSF